MNLIDARFIESPILVDERFDLGNGMMGMQRDVILRLCNLFSYNFLEIRAIIGMCEEHFLWKSHSFFVEGRPQKISTTFLKNPKGGYTLTQTPEGEKCYFTVGNDRTLFLGNDITTGIYRWTVKISYAFGTNPCSFWIGAACGCLYRFDDFTLGALSEHGPFACCFWSSREGDGSFSAGMSGKHTHAGDGNAGTDAGASPHLPPVPDGAFVAVEADAITRTVSFFVNERKVPCAFASVPFPLHLGISGYGKPSFTVVSFYAFGSPPVYPRAWKV